MLFQVFYPRFFVLQYSFHPICVFAFFEFYFRHTCFQRFNIGSIFTISHRIRLQGLNSSLLSFNGDFLLLELFPFAILPLFELFALRFIRLVKLILLTRTLFLHFRNFCKRLTHFIFFLFQLERDLLEFFDFSFQIFHPHFFHIIIITFASSNYSICICLWILCICLWIECCKHALNQPRHWNLIGDHFVSFILNLVAFIHLFVYVRYIYHFYLFIFIGCNIFLFLVISFEFPQRGFFRRSFFDGHKNAFSHD
mmetsp:Transcript_36049/g.44798  ORF Transcript_36049/g.44798 Transcript_36049/m.44798 type:complete len:253 (-) Transcript_36049:2000-2758(-)